MHAAVMPADQKWLASIPKQFSKGSMYAYVMDSNFRTNFSSAQQGDLLFRYSITTSQFDETSETSRNFGWANGNPLIPFVMENGNNGSAAVSGSFVEIDKPNVMVLTIKHAEDGKGFIVRLIESKGQNVDATITVPCLLIKKAYLSNLVEKNIKAIDCSDHKVTVPISASGIVTVRLETD
jgi:alpha-mannosidase